MPHFACVRLATLAVACVCVAAAGERARLLLKSSDAHSKPLHWLREVNETATDIGNMTLEGEAVTETSDIPGYEDMSPMEQRKAVREKAKEEAKQKAIMKKKLEVKDFYMKATQETQESLDNVRETLHGLGVLNVSVQNQADGIRRWTEDLRRTMEESEQRVDDKLYKVYQHKIVIIPTAFPASAEFGDFQHKLDEQLHHMQEKQADQALSAGVGAMPHEFYH